MVRSAVNVVLVVQLVVGKVPEYNWVGFEMMVIE